MRRSVVGSTVALVVLVSALLGCSGASDGAAPEPKLVARFTYEVDAEVVNPTSCPATAVRLRDRSTGGPTAWRWRFADGSTSTEQHPIVAPALAQGAEVTLTVSRGSETAVRTETITYVEC